MFHLLANEVVPRIANTSVQVPVVRTILGTADTFSVDANIAFLAETAALVEIFVKSALRNDNR